MRILLIGNFVPDRQESMLRFAQLLTAGLRDAGHEVTTWSPEPQLVRLLPTYRYGGPSKFIGYVDKFLLFPRQVKRRLRGRLNADIVHIIDHANSIYGPLFAGRPLLATCHDLLQIRAARGEFKEHRVSGLGRRYKSWILKSIGKLPHVATPSTETAVQLQRLTPLTPDRISVIPLGLNFPYRRASSTEALPIVKNLLVQRNYPAEISDHGGRGFLLNIGGGQWYKNRGGLIEMYAALRQRLQPVPRLLLVGKPLSAELSSRAQQLGMAEDIVHVSNVSELELQALYSCAEALIFPSWHEGFGWPVAEAQSCGCPVFTSDRAPMTEVGGDGAYYIDPGEPVAAAAKIAAFWPKRAELSARGLARASEWSQTRMIERYLATYARLAPALQVRALA